MKHEDKIRRIQMSRSSNNTEQQKYISRIVVDPHTSVVNGIIFFKDSLSLTQANSSNV